MWRDEDQMISMWMSPAEILAGGLRLPQRNCALVYSLTKSFKSKMWKKEHDSDHLIVFRDSWKWNHLNFSHERFFCSVSDQIKVLLLYFLSQPALLLLKYCRRTWCRLNPKAKWCDFHRPHLPDSLWDRSLRACSLPVDMCVDLVSNSK